MGTPGFRGLLTVDEARGGAGGRASRSEGEDPGEASKRRKKGTRRQAFFREPGVVCACLTSQSAMYCSTETNRERNVRKDVNRSGKVPWRRKKRPKSLKRQTTPSCAQWRLTR